MKKRIVKTFNVKDAQNGATVETKSGHSVRIICYDRKGNYPIIALVDYGTVEDYNAYSIEGKYIHDRYINEDLVIIEEVEETKFNVGDWVFMNTHGSQPWLVTKVTPNYYEIKDSFGHITVKSHSTIDSLFHPWTLKDAKPGNVLCCEDGRPFMFKKLCGTYPVVYFGIDVTNHIYAGTGGIWCRGLIRPATFRESNALFKQLMLENYEYNIDTHEITKQEISWRNKEGLGTKMSLS